MSGTRGQILRVNSAGAAAWSPALVELLDLWQNLGIPLNGSASSAQGTSDAVLFASGQVNGLNVANSAFGAFRLKPADWPTIADKTAKVRLFVSWAVNAVAPGAGYELTVALKPVISLGGAAAGDVRALTVGAAVVSTTLSGLAASGAGDAVSAEVAAPAADLYVVTLKANQALAATSAIKVQPQLQRRWA